MTGTRIARSPKFAGITRIFQPLFRPVDASSLAVFRILFGSLLFISILRFFLHGWIDQLYIQPRFFFTFLGFSWIHPWPAWGMYLHFFALALLALGITWGFCYRLCTLLFFLGFAYMELLDVTNYLNHYYLVGLVSFLLIFLPAQRTWSLDAKAGEQKVPLLAVWILRGQLILVYFFAGLGKLQSDWLGQAQPLRIWLSARSDLPWLGPWLQEPWVAYAMSWSGAFYDLTITFCLLWKRPRPWAFVLVIVFHALTAFLFPTIGMFPWFMIALTTIFFPPDWPRNLLDRFRPTPSPSPSHPADLPPYKIARSVLVVIGIFFAWQVLWPIRHFAYPGNNLWTEEAYRFSWNVMLMEKAGQIEFFLKRPGSKQRESAEINSWLTPLQQRMMSTQPDLILQTAKEIAAREKKRSGETVAVYAETMVSLNGRPPAPLIDPEVDLTTQTDSFFPKSWILPLPPSGR